MALRLPLGPAVDGDDHGGGDPVFQEAGLVVRRGYGKGLVDYLSGKQPPPELRSDGGARRSLRFTDRRSFAPGNPPLPPSPVTGTFSASTGMIG